MRTEFRGVVTGLALVAAAILAAITVNLGIPGRQLLETLRFHIALAFLPLPLLLAILGAPIRAIVTLAIILASLAHGGWIVLDQLARRNGSEGVAPAGSFTLMSHNVLATNADGGRIGDHIAATQPDIAVILETPGIATSLPRLDAIYPFRIGCAAPQDCDITLLSRLPVLEASIHRFGPFRRQRLIVARVDVAGQAVTIIALHLSKPYFDDFSWIELTEIRTLLRTTTGPVVVAGDFNAAPWAGWPARLASQMQLAPPPTFPATWPAELGDFGLPIDTILTRDGALITDISALPDPMGSNHRGLVATIAVSSSAP